MQSQMSNSQYASIKHHFKCSKKVKFVQPDLKSLTVFLRVNRSDIVKVDVKLGTWQTLVNPMDVISVT